VSPDSWAETETETEAARRFWRRALQLLWTSLIVLAGVGVLLPAALRLEWGRYVVPCLLGGLAGLAIAVALLGSALSRHLTGIVLGAFTLPLLAAHLGTVAIRSELEFGAYSASLLPFITWAAVAALGVLGIARIWRAGPDAPTPPPESKGAQP